MWLIGCETQIVQFSRSSAEGEVPWRQLLFLGTVFCAHGVGTTTEVCLEGDD